MKKPRKKKPPTRLTQADLRRVMTGMEQLERHYADHRAIVSECAALFQIITRQLHDIARDAATVRRIIDTNPASSGVLAALTLKPQP
jgi:hypothetical protein